MSVGTAAEVMLAKQAIEVPLAEAREPDGFRRVPFRLPQGLNQHDLLRLIRLLAERVTRVILRLRGQSGVALSKLRWKVGDLERIPVGE